MKILKKNIIEFIPVVTIVLFLSGCAASIIENKYKELHKDENKRFSTEIETIQSNHEGRLVDINHILISKNTKKLIDDCGSDSNCQKETYNKFIFSLKNSYERADFIKIFTMCNNVCKTPRQLEYLVAADHNFNLKNEIEYMTKKEEQKHKNIVQNLNAEFQREYLLAKERDRQTALAFAAGLQAAGQAMQQQAAYQQSMVYSGYNYYPMRPSYLTYNQPTNTRPSYLTYNQPINTSSSYMGSGMTYYSGEISGTSQRIGSFTYHNINSGLSGTSQDIGNFTYHNFNSGLSGTTQRIGSFTYHNFNSGTAGTTQSIGNFDYTNFSDGTHCTTQYIGNTAYTNCY